MKSKFITLFLCLFLAISTFAQDQTIRILAIGNSFSEDAIENYLSNLVKAEGQKVIIGNLYIGGASLELHVKNAKIDKPAYAYRKIDLDGNKKSTKNVSIAEAIKEEDWDYISIQQASSFSGQKDVIAKDLPILIEYVNAIKPPKTKLIYHQTWAYQQDSKHKGFANYNNNQMEMYNGIVEATKKIDKSKQFTYIIPAGTAIQNGRTSSLGDNFTRDGYHLDLNYGRFTAACTWYEKIFNKDVRKNPYKPERLTELQASIAKEAAHKAVQKPWKVSKIKL